MYRRYVLRSEDCWMGREPVESGSRILPQRGNGSKLSWLMADDDIDDEAAGDRAKTQQQQHDVRHQVLLQQPTSKEETKKTVMAKTKLTPTISMTMMMAEFEQ